MLQNAKPVVLLHTKNELSKRNQENNPIYNRLKIKVPQNKFNKGSDQTL
jgi:hypothetical protein